MPARLGRVAALGASGGGKEIVDQICIYNR